MSDLFSHSVLDWCSYSVIRHWGHYGGNDAQATVHCERHEKVWEPVQFLSPCCSCCQYSDVVMRDIRVTKWLDSKVQPHHLRSSCLSASNLFSAIVCLLASEISSIPENHYTCACSACVWWLWDWLSGISCAVMCIGAGPSPHPKNRPGTYGHRSRKHMLCPLLYVSVEPHCETDNSYGIS